MKPGKARFLVQVSVHFPRRHLISFCAEAVLALGVWQGEPIKWIQSCYRSRAKGGDVSSTKIGSNKETRKFAPRKLHNQQFGKNKFYHCVHII
jgi:hypothetical protein